MKTQQYKQTELEEMIRRGIAESEPMADNGFAAELDSLLQTECRSILRYQHYKRAASVAAVLAMLGTAVALFWPQNGTAPTPIATQVPSPPRPRISAPPPSNGYYPAPQRILLSRNGKIRSVMRPGDFETTYNSSVL